MAVVSFYLCDTAPAYNIFGGFKPRANTRFAFVGWGQLVLANTLDQVLSIVSLIRDRMGTPAQGNTLAGVDGAIGTQTTAIKAKTDNLPALPASQGDVTAVSTKVDKVQALCLQNAVREATFTGNNMTSCIIYCYDTAAHAITNDHATGLLYTITGFGTYIGSNNDLFRLTS